MKKMFALMLIAMATSAFAGAYCEKTVGCQEPCDGEYAESYAENMADCQIKNEREEFWSANGCEVDIAANDCNVLSVIADVKASKSLKNQGKNNYDAKNLLNADDKVWAATFTGEPIKLDFKVKAKAVFGVAVRNGYRKDEKSFKNNSRIQTMTILADGRKIGSYTLEKREYESYMGYDEIKFGKPLVGVKTLTVVIESIYDGAKWKDVCVDEIVVVGQ